MSIRVSFKAFISIMFVSMLAGIMYGFGLLACFKNNLLGSLLCGAIGCVCITRNFYLLPIRLEEVTKDFRWPSLVASLYLGVLEFLGNVLGLGIAGTVFKVSGGDVSVICCYQSSYAVLVLSIVAGLVYTITCENMKGSSSGSLVILYLVTGFGLMGAFGVHTFLYYALCSMVGGSMELVVVSFLGNVAGMVLARYNIFINLGGEFDDGDDSRLDEEE